MWVANVSSECEWQLAMIGNYSSQAIWPKRRGRCLRLVVALAWRHSLSDCFCIDCWVGEYQILPLENA